MTKGFYNSVHFIALLRYIQRNANGLIGSNIGYTLTMNLSL
jgi:hypothetical protein